MRKGLFISVDGPNGAGKTTFIRTLVENLSVNYDVYDTAYLLAPLHSF